MYKLVQEKKLDAFRNYFVNLALPLFTYGDPIACEVQETKLGGKRAAAGQGLFKFSEWDTLDVDLGRDVTLQELIDHFESEFGLDLQMMSYGPAMFYFSFGLTKKKMRARLDKLMADIVQEVGGGASAIKPGQKYFIFEALVCDEDGEDVEVPPVRLKFR
jgi:ubiquitin-activating enzyme E1